MRWHVARTSVCQYCNYSFHDGWADLLAYDDVYQAAMATEASERSHGFYDDWDDLRDQVTPGEDAGETERVGPR